MQNLGLIKDEVNAVICKELFIGFLTGVRVVLLLLARKEQVTSLGSPLESWNTGMIDDWIPEK